MAAIQAAQNQNQTNKGSLAKLLKLRSMTSPYLGRQNSWVLIDKCKTEISIKTESSSSSTKRSHFLLTLELTSTFHKVQDLSLEQGVIDSDLRQRK